VNLGLAGKVAIVTGSSRGIGRAIATSLAADGCRVVMCARGAADLESAVAEVCRASASQRAAIGVVADVSTPEGVEELVKRARLEFDGVDIIVNNVGSAGAHDFAAADEADFRVVFDRNLFPALSVSRAALPLLKARGGGVIVMIASVYGREAGGGISYNVVKAAEISLAKAMARALAREKIRVLSVAPGSVLIPNGAWDRRRTTDPAMYASFLEREIPWGRFGMPQEIADVVTFLCSPRAAWVTGACIPVDGGQSRAF
jgi:3-oxoacyl-[acyl-carrier protein] reductase